MITAEYKKELPLQLYTAHLSGIAVSNGQKVEKNTVILAMKELQDIARVRIFILRVRLDGKPANPLGFIQ
ncbi:MAG: M23 family metallopeptidase [Bacillus subtilis]|nr:M23 family metallopeptidase [Bacillus subtilis]